MSSFNGMDWCEQDNLNNTLTEQPSFWNELGSPLWPSHGRKPSLNDGSGGFHLRSSSSSVTHHETVPTSPNTHVDLDTDAETEVDLADETVWHVLQGLDKVLVETTKQNHGLLSAEIEDLMEQIEQSCFDLGLDPSTLSPWLGLPVMAPITLVTSKALHTILDELLQKIIRRNAWTERWVTRIIIMADQICEPYEPFLKTSFPSASRARLAQMSRVQEFDLTVGKLRARWDHCAYLPTDDYDHALCRLFGQAEQGWGMSAASQGNFIRLEPPLCLSRQCLAHIRTKLDGLDQVFLQRQARVRAMEPVVRALYKELKVPMEHRTQFGQLATVRYAAELGRTLKSLQAELEARTQYRQSSTWDELKAEWERGLVPEDERIAFRNLIENTGMSYVERLQRIRDEIEACRRRYSRCERVLKLLMSRKSHIEKMIAFEQTASDPKRLFQSSFQLVEEEKFRRKAYPTLLKLEEALLEAVNKYERENNEPFMFDGQPYLQVLQKEISNRHVNHTVFAKFTPEIVAPTRSQTQHILSGSGTTTTAAATMSPPASPPRTSSKSSTERVSISTQALHQRSSHGLRANTLPSHQHTTRTYNK
ncbi:carboxypeptidase C prc1 [Actinomortierella wolfii]|nr:carboxypeptidase C prc1 [Actinomortierella wolfii]